MSDSADAGDIEVRVAKSKVEALRANEQKPKFVTLPVGCEGHQRRRPHLHGANLQPIAKQINSDQPDG